MSYFTATAWEDQWTEKETYLHYRMKLATDDDDAKLMMQKIMIEDKATANANNGCILYKQLSYTT